MKYSTSFDGRLRANFTLNIRLSKKEVEKLRRFLKKKGKRGLDIDVRRCVTEMGSSVASDDMIDYIERIEE